ncbi:class F sortase [Streptomyces pluripotens]|uniref:Class F sortase n=1 Tax=Streptomyces pluripotens TaxID=1355015 RepID=A0A221NWU2_9ACTN|nr:MULTISPECIES: class F sortase [Streptomyces]ARP70113.1 class F sortase [Streptomyces pluripotens]ASN24372.1 class F sortase [Streptomyces pluripotens]KIE23437.1 peptidase C60 [Streptomyces sp. MUSC 125]MCH0559100.1 class F sortase [Streptomyces sp. MUM 16J]
MRRNARLGDTVIAALTVVALGSGVWLLDGAGTHAPPQPSAAEGRPDPGGEWSAAAALAPSPPTRIRIPSIRVNAPLTGLALTRSGSLEAPPAGNKNLAGWYAAGTMPGETGTAIVAGHVDNADGPAVFYDLGALKRGARIEVDRQDGTVAVFIVDAVEVYAARDFPDEKVYGAAPRPELRVITCGGGYSRTTGYQGNVVVFARLTGSH